MFSKEFLNNNQVPASYYLSNDSGHKRGVSDAAILQNPDTGTWLYMYIPLDIFTCIGLLFIEKNLRLSSIDKLAFVKSA